MANHDIITADWRFKEIEGELAVAKYVGCDTVVEIPSCVGGRRVTRIGNRAFAEDSDITEVTVPSGVTRIGNEAFWGCERLSKLTLPNGLTVIGDSAFTRCLSLTGIILPKGLAEIGRDAFAGCKALVNIEFPKGLREIKTWAFSGCCGLTRLTLPEGLTVLGEEVFVGCSELREIFFPTTLTEMGAMLFAGLNNLKRVVLPHGITAIGNRSFQNCYGLTEIDIPDTVTRIGDSAFCYCRNLGGVKLLPSVTYVGNDAFIGTAVTEVSIPDGAQIGSHAFEGCSQLKRVFARGRDIKLGVRAFFRCYGIEEFHISAKAAARIDRYDVSSYHVYMTVVVGAVNTDVPKPSVLTEKAVRHFLSEHERGEAAAEEVKEWAEYLKKRLPRFDDGLRNEPAVYGLLIETGVLKPKDTDVFLALTNSPECRAVLLRYGNSLRDGKKNVNGKKYTL